MIEKVFKDLNPYLRGIKKSDDYSIIEVVLKKSWKIPTSSTIQNQAKNIDEPNMVYHLFYSEDTVDNLIEWVKTDVIDMNIEIEQKEALLKEKVNQLKEMFESSSLDELKKLKFTSEESVLSLNGSSKNNTDKKEKEKV